MFILFAAILLLLPLNVTYASTNGTIEVQATIQEGFVEPITVEVTGKEEYEAKLLITAENGYVLRKQLPNGKYTITSIYTNSKEETDSQMWASTETFEIVAGKTTVLNVAVLDDADDRAEILFGEEHNPFGLVPGDEPEDFMAQNAVKYETESTESSHTGDSSDDEEVVKPNESTEEDTDFTTEPSEEKDEGTIENKSEKQTAWEKLIDLIIRLARYILLSVLIMAGVSAIVWIYRRVKYGA